MTQTNQLLVRRIRLLIALASLREEIPAGDHHLALVSEVRAGIARILCCEEKRACLRLWGRVLSMTRIQHINRWRACKRSYVW